MIVALPLALILPLADPPEPGAPAHVNALANETSPCLLQHQYNPVDVQRTNVPTMASRVQLLIRYQLCNDQVCLQPKAEVVPVLVQLR